MAAAIDARDEYDELDRFPIVGAVASWRKVLVVRRSVVLSGRGTPITPTETVRWGS